MQRYSGLVLYHLALVHVEKEGKSQLIFYKKTKYGLSDNPYRQEERNSET